MRRAVPLAVAFAAVLAASGPPAGVEPERAGPGPAAARDGAGTTWDLGGAAGPGAPAAGSGAVVPASTVVRTTTEGPSAAAAVAIRFALAQVGLPYVWGGDGPAAGEVGFDCSGLTHAAYVAAGITLPRTAHTQYHRGPLVAPGSPLMPGDLVFYGTPARVHHVGLYLGGGRMVNAPRRGELVQVAPYRWAGDSYLGASRPAAGPGTGSVWDLSGLVPGPVPTPAPGVVPPPTVVDLAPPAVTGPAAPSLLVAQEPDPVPDARVPRLAVPPPNEPEPPAGPHPQATPRSPGTTDPPGGTTDPPGDADPPGGTTDPPATTTDPPATTTDPPATTTDPPATTTDPPATRTDPPATRTDPPATTTDPPPPAPVAVATAAGATTPVQAVRAGEGGSLVLVLSPGTLTPWPVPGEAITLRFSDGRTELRTVTGGDAAAGTVTVA